MWEGALVHVYLVRREPRDVQFGPFRFNYWVKNEHKKGIGFNFYLFGISLALSEKGGER